MIWPDTLVERLRALCAQKRTSGQIAKELGVTRNAVVGKVSRLGLTLSYQGQRQKAESPKRKAAPRPKIKPKPAIRKVKAMQPCEPIEVPVNADAPLSTSRPCKLVHLTTRSCRFPLGDPRDEAFRFCGGRKEPEAAYCASHSAFARGVHVRFAPRHPGKRTPPNLPGSSRILEVEA